MSSTVRMSTISHRRTTPLSERRVSVNGTITSAVATTSTQGMLAHEPRPTA